MNRQEQTENTTANSILAIGGVSSPLYSFVVAESFVLRIKFSAKNPPHRQAENRQDQNQLFK